MASAVLKLLFKVGIETKSRCMQLKRSKKRGPRNICQYMYMYLDHFTITGHYLCHTHNTYALEGLF